MDVVSVMNDRKLARATIQASHDISGEKDDIAKTSLNHIFCTAQSSLFVLLKRGRVEIFTIVTRSNLELCWKSFSTQSQAETENILQVVGVKHSRGSNVCEICPRLDKETSLAT